MENWNMKKAFPAKHPGVLLVALSCLALLGCGQPNPTHWQGYLEGEFVYVAAPLSGQLDQLAVSRGDRVGVGAPLFALEQTAEIAARQEAAERVKVAQARLADLQTGARPSEIAALEARLAQARSAAELSGNELNRQEELRAAQVNSAETFDRAKLTHQKNLSAVDELTAQLDTARLGGRSATVAAAEAEVSAAQAAWARADWSVTQKSQTAPQAGLVYDTLYRAGEFVPAAKPVVVLLPAENIKVRFFVAETVFGSLKVGDGLHVNIDGRDRPLTARISYLSPQPEYTPPVLYNRENRAKLTFMVEAALDAADARELHPGQPVDVEPVK
jgi:HlyD family secretion protein